MNNEHVPLDSYHTISIPRMDRTISALLLDVGFPHHLYGFTYIAYAIELIMQDPERLHHITKDIYPDIAMRYKTTPSRVERAIRTSIQSVWLYGNKQLISAIFHYSIRADKGHPTNTQLLAALYYYLLEGETKKPA